VKIKIRLEDNSGLRENGWFQTDGWLAELRDDGRADPPGDAHAGPDGVSGPWPEALAAADALAEARARAQADARAEARARAQADARAQAEADARAEAAARAEMTGRAVIGDQLRMPIMWCEMGSCISWHADPAALGEADTRARAIDAGWRIDAFGRLACPRCQQTDPGFWATGPVVRWDRYTAVARAARAAGCGDGTAAWGNSGDPGRAAGGYPPAGPLEPGWHQ
jgi:hypothetical protein